MIAALIIELDLSMPGIRLSAPRLVTRNRPPKHERMNTPFFQPVTDHCSPVTMF